MNTFTNIRLTITDLCDELLFVIPARFLTARNVAVLARVPNRRFQWYLWNIIDHCDTRKSPENLWDVQESNMK